MSVSQSLGALHRFYHRATGLAKSMRAMLRWAASHSTPKQVAVDQDSLLIVAKTLSNHPNYKGEAIPTLDAIPAEVGKPRSGGVG
jgi:hypothetical protein